MDEINPGDYVTVPKLRKNRPTSERLKAQVKLIFPPYVKVAYFGRDRLVEASCHLSEVEKL